MTMINSLSDPQKRMIRTVVAGAPDYLQRQATATLRALERMGYVVDGKPTHHATEAGRALIEEEALNGQLASAFHVGQSVEYSRWHSTNGFHQHEWIPATIHNIFHYHHVSLKFEDGTHKMVFARHVRAVPDKHDTCPCGLSMLSCAIGSDLCPVPAFVRTEVTRDEEISD